MIYQVVVKRIPEPGENISDGRIGVMTIQNVWEQPLITIWESGLKPQTIEPGVPLHPDRGGLHLAMEALVLALRYDAADQVKVALRAYVPQVETTHKIRPGRKFQRRGKRGHVLTGEK